jgi:cytidine deaminase
MTREIKTIIHEFDSVSDLEPEERALAIRAQKAAENAYAPYSQFKVGASVLLENGKVVDGSNQENAAYPSGICAERVAISYASATFPDLQVRTSAITAFNREQLTREPVSPCGFCRQVMIETELKQNSPLRVILVGKGKVQVIESARQLLPLYFDGSIFSTG